MMTRQGRIQARGEARRTDGRVRHRRRAIAGWTVLGLEARVLLSAPTLKVTGVSVIEPDSGTVTANVKISLSAATTQNVTFDYATANGTATAPTDYTAISTTPGTIPAGQTSMTVPVTINADPIATEANESFYLDVTNIAGASNTSAKGTVTIDNDDNSLSIGGVTQTVGTSGTFNFAFPVTLSGPTTTFPVTVKFKTSDGTAKVSDGDYDAASGTLTIPAGQSSGTVNVTVNGSGSDPAGSETFYVTLSGAKNALISTAKATGTIINPAPGWTELGPEPILNGGTPGSVNPSNDSGRITGIAVNPNNANNIYIAAAGGGVWDTTNGGTSWTPLTDNQQTTAMGAIAIAPSNPSIIYAGTGEANLSIDSFYGVGVLKSTDGGNTWTLLGNSVFNRMTISKIVVDPSNPDIVYVATNIAGDGNGVYNLGGAGVWKSTDGGNTWTNVFASVESGSTDFGSVTDLVMNPSNDQILYAAVGDIFGDAINGVYESTNAGTSWTELSGPATGTLVGRIALGISHDGQTLYAAETGSYNTGANFGKLTGFYRSTNGGSSWTSVSGVPNFAGEQGWYDLVLAVDPNDSQRVYAAGAPDYNAGNYSDIIIRSDNGGSSWTSLVADSNGNGPHTDHHALVFDSSGNLLDGNDGGIWKLNNPSSSSFTWSDLNGNLGISESEGVGAAASNASIVLTGTQDNGTAVYNGSAGWPQTWGGDGGIARVDPVTPSVMYTENTYISLRISTNGGSTWSSDINGINTSDNAQFYVPYNIDPSNHDRLILGTDNVYETTNQGASWHVIGSFLDSTNTITAVAIAPTAPNTIFVAFSDGSVFTTTNDGTSWTHLTSVPSGLNITGIAVDPNTASTVYLVSYSIGSSGTSQVWESTNSGSSWTNISGNLPNIPVHSIAVDGRSSPTILYVGTQMGVYESTNGGTTWSVFKTGLPNVPVFDMQLSTADNTLTIGTHGRGVWQVPISSTGNFAGFAYPLNLSSAGSSPSSLDLGTRHPVLAPQHALGGPRYGLSKRPTSGHSSPVLMSSVLQSAVPVLSLTLPSPLLAATTATPTVLTRASTPPALGTPLARTPVRTVVPTASSGSSLVPSSVLSLDPNSLQAIDMALDLLGDHRHKPSTF